MKTKQDIDKKMELFLDEVLKTSPECSLSSDFAENLKRKVYTTFLWKRYLKEFFISLGAASLVVGVTFVILYFINVDYFKDTLSYILEYRGLLLFAVAIVVVLFFYNYVLLNFMLYYYKNKFSKS